ncbi:LCP family protein [Demequina sp. NBRC 110051]|uniref:LCP family protein n=1 Tax=Demequina sp. NBRC 110051 TaxID=1570340 RepID=UPI00117FDCE3|nr:LCP family protein [Demequina sp. NBRC 110051]
MSPAPTRSRARHGARTAHRRVLVGLASGVAALAGFALVYGGTSALLLQGSFETHDTSSLLASGEGETAVVGDSPNDFAAGEPLNIVLIGTDERNGENAEIGGDVAGGMRGDTTMVMHISADRSRIDVVSIPRDSRVKISDCKMYDGSVVKGWTAKFNVALANGGKNGDRGEGAACVMQTIMDLTGVDLGGHFVMVDFSGFEDMVDAIKGVPMCITQDMTSKKAKLDLEAGAQVLDGETALAFARARTGTGLGGDGTDLARIERQQELLTNTARKVLGMNYLTDVSELTQFVRAGAESLSMDSEMGSLNNIIGLAYSLRNFETSNLNFYTVPWHYPGDGQGDVVWTEPEATAMWQAIIDDVPIESTDPTVENPTAEPSAEPSVTASPDATASAEPSATPSETATTPTPSVSPSPLRETQEEILEGCVIPE